MIQNCLLLLNLKLSFIHIKIIFLFYRKCRFKLLLSHLIILWLSAMTWTSLSLLHTRQRGIIQVLLDTWVHVFQFLKTRDSHKTGNVFLSFHECSHFPPQSLNCSWSEPCMYCRLSFVCRYNLGPSNRSMYSLLRNLHYVLLAFSKKADFLTSMEKERMEKRGKKAQRVATESSGNLSSLISQICLKKG